MAQQEAVYLRPEVGLHLLCRRCRWQLSELFIAEVKFPLRNRNSNDFVKLDLTMKQMLDKLVKSGLDSPVVAGLHVDGFNCYIYEMELNHKAVYKMLEVGSFTPLINEADFPSSRTCSKRS
ncbi:uncharacterized protein B0P05DRAFT_530450 [Gilbertella persicaria]|uniref:uncharacterized protein n=1 Tax=Gilbertella persicaria TaxID=101096 RepID=UPI00221E534D|nr:uncharacterized protein B0P05DRAFT_530450 [Gilbertella persicaria]KAI8087863.1 hypothetical protein B0P05DRAFT_530450 [Gilbertella persicaria]